MSAIPFRRLVLVEARKLFDTRSGKALAAILVGLLVFAVVARGAASGPRLFTLLGTEGLGLGTLLPVLGILTVTCEWGHRTALTTFTLEPRRVRLLAAKCLPPLLTAVAASLFAMLVAAGGTAVAAGVQHAPAVWRVAPLALLGWTATNVLLAAAGLALGMLLLNAPAAIVIYLCVPVLGSAVGRLGTAGATLVKWFDLSTTTGPLASGDLTGAGVARLAASVALWIVVPLAAGMVRAARREVT